MHSFIVYKIKYANGGYDTKHCASLEEAKQAMIDALYRFKNMENDENRAYWLSQLDGAKIIRETTIVEDVTE